MNAAFRALSALGEFRAFVTRTTERQLYRHQEAEKHLSEDQERKGGVRTKHADRTPLTVYPVSLPDASSAIFLSLSRSSSRPLLDCPSCSQLPNTSRATPTTPPFCPPFFSSAAFCCLSLRRTAFRSGALILTDRRPTPESDPERAGSCFLSHHDCTETHISIRLHQNSACLLDLEDADGVF